MKWVHYPIALLFALTLLAPAAIQACPLCAEAVSATNTGSGDEETNDFPKAMNQSIYLMVGVPYAALGIVGFMIYRGCKLNAAFKQSAQSQESV